MESVRSRPGAGSRHGPTARAYQCRSEPTQAQAEHATQPRWSRACCDTVPPVAASTDAPRTTRPPRTRLTTRKVRLLIGNLEPIVVLPGAGTKGARPVPWHFLPGPKGPGLPHYFTASSIAITASATTSG